MHQLAHGHQHQHGATARAADNLRRLAAALALVSVYTIAEFAGGYWANSLALMADAGHMLSDAAALALSMFAIWVARRPATSRRTFGYYRAEILAALVNGATLLAISGWIIVEAIGRFRAPPPVIGPVMLAIAAGGLLVNIAGLAILSGGRAGSLNVRSAWLHMLTDALGSVAAILAGIMIWTADWRWVDPAASVVIALLVVHSAWGVVSESVAILMESAPRHINLDEVREALLSLEGAAEVHSLHVWTITSGFEALSAHVVVQGDRQPQAILSEIREMVHARFGIDHITVQIEPVGFEEHRPNF